MSINYNTRAAALRLIQKIDGQIDPFDVAMGTSSGFQEDIDELVRSLGGRKDPREMTPAGVAVYLLALLIANDS